MTQVTSGPLKPSLDVTPPKSADLSIKTVANWVTSVNRVFETTALNTSAGASPERTQPAIVPAPEQVYPHLFDPQGASGQALAIVDGALEDARSALKSFGDSDLESVGSRLAQVAAAMQMAHKLTSFNEDFGAVISFIRRATLTADATEVSRAMLNALVSALGSLKKAPALDLEDAGSLVDGLEDSGWRGEHPVVDALMAVLFPDESAELVRAGDVAEQN
ncbi:hypothetical protein PTKU64_21890 [Paraburkholderia terrae]|uniref:Uncharacterized protein n=1 Tax=Paraburkholderia terrae TaxID=311230 RepID=A0ABM7TJX0_9BURK|nr:hypothetical protein [Paraburkholderia terrae]BCZ78514.1 hypothetical protein PTKU64_21890 [Paraburkholderia terrae]